MDTAKVAALANRSVRWVQWQASQGNLSPAQVVREGGCRRRFLFEPAAVVRQLAALGAMAAIDEQVKVFLRGLVRNDVPLAEAMWLVIAEEVETCRAARLTGANPNRVRAAVQMYRGDVQAFVTERVGWVGGRDGETERRRDEVEGEDGIHEDSGG